ncbi:MAG TPA: hypothetical protein VE709_13860 [Pseudonocardiaceae bacterium]|nr:hypothetical protein [Pseudonocardiaceae bacterium]
MPHYPRLPVELPVSVLGSQLDLIAAEETACAPCGAPVVSCATTATWTVRACGSPPT